MAFSSSSLIEVFANVPVLRKRGLPLGTPSARAPSTATGAWVDALSAGCFDAGVCASCADDAASVDVSSAVPSCVTTGAGSSPPPTSTVLTAR